MTPWSESKLTTSTLLRSPLVRAAGVVALANLLFLALVVAVQGDRQSLLARIREAFATGELGQEDYRRFDPRRGFHQYNDCNILQMITNEDSSRIERALAPRLRYRSEAWEGQCAVLHRLVVDRVESEAPLVLRYARYWHGHNVVAVFGLSLLGMRELRRVLTAGVWTAVGLLSLMAWRSGRYTRAAGLIIGATAATVWAVPYFAPGLTHGPGEAVLLVALAAIAAWPRMTLRLSTMVPYAAGFGAIVVFFEMLTGQLPVAAGWLAALTLAARRDQPHEGGISAPRVVLAAVVSFGLGAAATVLAKQGLADAFAEPHAGAAFLTNLRYYMRWPEPAVGLPGFLLPFARLVWHSDVLTYGSRTAGICLIAATTVVWLTSAIRGWRARRFEYGHDVLTIAAAALVPVAWTILLPVHTDMHASFMVRMLVVPISLAPLALFWPSGNERTPGPEGTTRQV